MFNPPVVPMGFVKSITASASGEGFSCWSSSVDSSSSSYNTTLRLLKSQYKHLKLLYYGPVNSYTFVTSTVLIEVTLRINLLLTVTE